MKKIIILAYMSLLCISCNSSQTHKKYFENQSVNLNSTGSGMMIEGYLTEFFLRNNRYPVSLEDFYKYGTSGELESWEIDVIKRTCLIDPYVTDTTDYIRYMPIFDKTQNIPVSYLLLARGEDYQFNNNFEEKLYIDNWFVKVKAYNLKEVTKEIDKTIIRYPVWNRTQKRFVYSTFCIDNNEKAPLYGDTIFNHKTTDSIRASIKSGGSFNFIYYPKYSYWRAVFGKKDFIVAVGRKVVEYEIIPRSADAVKQ